MAQSYADLIVDHDLAQGDQRSALPLNALGDELRRPLSIARAALSNMEDGLQDRLSPDDMRRMLLIAERNLDRLARMLENALEMVKLETGRSLPEPRAVDLGRLLHEAVESHRVASERERGIPIVLAMPADLPRAQADPDMALQIINNLLDNARRHAAARIVVEASSADGRELVVSVRDDGAGVPVAKLAALFAPARHGAGLGLSISYELARLNGGRIWAENRPEGGAAFAFALPAARDAAERR